jgi:hypothetical protein
MRTAALVAAGVACLAISGCESTQDKSARLAKSGSKPFAEKGLRVTRSSSSVKVGGSWVLTDQNGTAVVADLHNDSKRALAGVPVAINVLDGKSHSVFRNNAPGLEPSLTSTSLIEPGQTVAWVNDQVVPAGTPKKVKVRIGVEKGTAPAKLPHIGLSSASLEDDPTSGVNAAGYVKNDSAIEQRKLVIFCVARRGARVVAAGRAGVARLKPGKRARFHVFFIGNPRGAKLELAAPPTVLQ